MSGPSNIKIQKKGAEEIGNSRGARLTKPLLEVAGLAGQKGHFPYSQRVRKTWPCVIKSLEDKDHLVRQLGRLPDTTLNELQGVLQAMFAV